MSASWRPSASVDPAGVVTTALVGIAGIAIGIGAETPPVTDTSNGGGVWPVAAGGGAGASCAMAGDASSAAMAKRTERIIRILYMLLPSRRLQSSSC